MLSGVLSIPSRRRKGPFKASLISLILREEFLKPAELKHRAKCALVKGAATPALLGKLDKTAVGFPVGKAMGLPWPGQCHPAGERSFELS